MRTGQLERDVGTGVAGADHEHRAGPQLRGVAVLRGVQLPDRRVQLVGELRARPVAAQAPAATTTLSAPAPGRRPSRPSARRRGPGCRRSRRCVPAAAVPRRTPRGSRPSRARSGTSSAAAGTAGPAARRTATGVNSRSESHRLRHDVPDPLVGLQDDARPAAPGEVVGGGEPGLAGADDDGLDVLAHGVLLAAVRRPVCRDARSAGRIARRQNCADPRVQFCRAGATAVRRGRARTRRRSPPSARRGRAW